MTKKVEKRFKTLFQGKRLDGAILMVNLIDSQIRTVKMFEEAIQKKGLPYFVVGNKVDRVRDVDLVEYFDVEVVYTSTLTGEGLDKVEELIAKRFKPRSKIIILGTFNSGKTSLISRLTELDLTIGKLLGTTTEYEAYPYKNRTIIDSIGWLADISKPNMVSIDFEGCVSEEEKIERVFNDEIGALQRTKARVLSDIKTVIHVLKEALDQGKKLVIIGAGASGSVAEVLAGLATETGIPAAVLTNVLGNDPPVSFARGTAEEELTLSERLLKTVEPGDIVIGVSVSGSTGFVYHALKLAKEKKAITVGITENLDSFLGEFSDYVILSDAKPEGPSASKTTIAQLAIVHSIILVLADLRGVTARQAIQNMYLERQGITKAGGVK